MQFTTLALAAAMAITPALADFNVYCGATANGFDGQGPQDLCMFFDNPPDCRDVESGKVQHFHQDDVSNCGGLRCEGCRIDRAPRDLEITELEFNDNQSCTGSTQYWSDGTDNDPHFTIYREGDSVSIIGSDGEEYGWCNVLTDGQEVQCSYGSGNIGLYHHFECFSPLSYIG